METTFAASSFENQRFQEEFLAVTEDIKTEIENPFIGGPRRRCVADAPPGQVPARDDRVGGVRPPRRGGSPLSSLAEFLAEMFSFLGCQGINTTFIAF